MTKHIPIKILKIVDNKLKLGRLKSQLHFLKFCHNIKIQYYMFTNIKNFSEKKINSFYKFTGKIKQPIDFRKYLILYFHKYLQYKLKNKYLKIQYL